MAFSTNATPIGYRYLVRHFEGGASGITDAQLAIIRNAGLITQAEYERALAGEPPEGYVPSF